MSVGCINKRSLGGLSKPRVRMKNPSCSKNKQVFKGMMYGGKGQYVCLSWGMQRSRNISRQVNFLYEDLRYLFVLKVRNEQSVQTQGIPN